MSTPDLENVLSEYASNIAHQQGNDARNWALLAQGGARFIELFRQGKFREASDLLEELEDVEYKLTLNCEATSLLGNGCGGYSVEDHGWVFGEEAVQAREEERQDDGDLPRTRSWTDVPMRRPVSLWLGGINTSLHGIVLRRSLRHLLLLGRKDPNCGQALEFVIKRHESIAWCSVPMTPCPHGFHVDPKFGKDWLAGIEGSMPFRTLKQLAFTIAYLGKDRPPLTLRLRFEVSVPIPKQRPEKEQLETMVARFGGVMLPDDEFRWGNGD